MEDDIDLRFDCITRNTLFEKLKKAMQATFPECFPGDLDFETSLVIRNLEGSAEGILLHQEIEKKFESQQRRRERVESLAANIEGVIEQLKQMDTAALGFVAWRGFEEISQADEVKNEFPRGMIAVLEAESWRESNITAMTNFALGVRKAINELPPFPSKHERGDTPLYGLSKELSAAMMVKRLFLENRINFTSLILDFPQSVCGLFII